MKDNTRYLLSTQPLAQGLINRASAKGITIDCVAFVDTKPIVHPDLEILINSLSRSPINAVFTSVHAVNSVVGYLAGKKPDWTIFCTGPVTRQTVVAYFGERAVAADGPSASALASLILAWENIREIVFFCAKNRRDDIPEQLSRRAIRVQEILVYESRDRTHQTDKPYDGIIFFSPGGVQSFFAANKVREDTRLFAIGKTTAEKIASYCDNQVILGESPVKELLVERAIDYFFNKISEYPGTAGKNAD